jgi:hypothetical protein
MSSVVHVLRHRPQDALDVVKIALAACSVLKETKSFFELRLERAAFAIFQCILEEPDYVPLVVLGGSKASNFQVVDQFLPTSSIAPFAAPEVTQGRCDRGLDVFALRLLFRLLDLPFERQIGPDAHV